MALHQVETPVAAGNISGNYGTVQGSVVNGEALKNTIEKLQQAGLVTDATQQHVPQSIAGSRQNNAALFNLLTELENMGLIVNNTTV